MSKRDPWDGILDDGESILWQGRPTPGWRPTTPRLVKIPFGLFFSGFAVFWMLKAFEMTGGVTGDAPGGILKFFWLAGLPFFFAGLGIIAGATVWPPYLHKYTWYTLTNQRAIIATHVPFTNRRLKSYPITADSPLELEEGAFQTIIFARETRPGKSKPYTVDIGFERITDGRDVYRKMRDIQTQASDRSSTS